MKLFIDGEWNSYQGDLISLALVSEDGSEWYEVLGCSRPDSWVAENVMPKLEKPQVAYEQMQESLSQFLNTFDRVHIIADWPEDLEWLCHVLITGPGERLDTPPLTMEVVRVDTVSKNPHNALADATALKDWYIAQTVQPATGCACKWNGEVYESRCELHEAWHVAIHEWAERAKTAEAKLAQPVQPEQAINNAGSGRLRDAAKKVDAKAHWINDEQAIVDYTEIMELRAALAQPTPAAYAQGYAEGFNDACREHTNDTSGH